MRIFAISDLHIDYPGNDRWLSQLSNSDYRDDVLIVAGDVSDKLELLRRCFAQLQRRFHQVLYVPGNHDLWVFRSDDECGIDKFNKIVDVASDNNISMSPWHRDNLTIVPLLGWYDYTFGRPCEWLQRHWMDFSACRWRGIDARAEAITQFFTGLNEVHLQCQNENLITFSHFLPRIDVMPDRIPAQHRRLYPVLGSNVIDQQLRQLNPVIHVYGHSHVNREIEIDGITYINNAFGSPKETRITRKELLCIFEM